MFKGNLLTPPSRLYPTAQVQGSYTNVKINDFGYAKKVHNPNSLTTKCGTEGFVAPEIIEHNPSYDVNCDVWSLGVVIYIILGGYRPFRGEGEDCMEKIRYGEYKFHQRTRAATPVG